MEEDVDVVGVTEEGVGTGFVITEDEEEDGAGTGFVMTEEEEDGTADATTRTSIVHIAVDNIVCMQMVSKPLLCYFCLQQLSPKLPVWCALTRNSGIFDANVSMDPSR